MLQHYEIIERAGIGNNAHYILGNERPEPISWYQVKWSDVLSARKTRSRTYPTDFYRKDTCTIYPATNTITNEIYIESTIKPLGHRISQHQTPLMKKASTIKQISVRQ